MALHHGQEGTPPLLQDGEGDKVQMVWHWGLSWTIQGWKKELLEMLTHYKSVCLKIVLNIQSAFEPFHYFSTTETLKKSELMEHQCCKR